MGDRQPARVGGQVAGGSRLLHPSDVRQLNTCHARIITLPLLAPLGYLDRGILLLRDVNTATACAHGAWPAHQSH